MKSFIGGVCRAQFIGKPDCNESGVAPAPRPAIDHLLLVGSSTTVMSYGIHPQYGSQVMAGRASMTAAGVDVPIINRAEGGSTIANLNTNIAAYMADVAGLSNVGVLINIGSNDIATTGYESMAPAARDAMAAGLDSIVAKVLAAGHTPILATVHSRPGLQDVYDSWAVNLYRPKIAELTPDWVDGGGVIFDYCGLFALHQDDADALSTSGASILNAPDGIPDWWQSDAVHPLLAAAGYRDYTSQRLAQYAACPALPAKERVIVVARAVSMTDPGGFNQILGTATSLSEIYNSSGVLKAGASFTKAAGYATSGGKTVPKNVTVSINRSDIQSGCIYASGPMSMTLSMGAAYASRTGVLRATGASSSASRVTRVTVSSGGAGSTFSASAPGVQIAEVSFVMDGSGSITVTAAPEAPSTIANLSGLEFEFDPV